ncbi:MAG: hypothetical protein Q9204_007983, partial [Flavoplaca sp. TL-2023a]
DVSHRSFQASIGDPTCAAGISTKTRFPVGLQTYNISTNRKIYDLFEDMITAHPALATSFVQFEAFPMQAVKAVDPASTAYAHRQDDILVFVSLLYSTPSPPLSPNQQIKKKIHLPLTNPPHSPQGILHPIPSLPSKRSSSHKIRSSSAAAFRRGRFADAIECLFELRKWR